MTARSERFEVSAVLQLVSDCSVMQTKVIQKFNLADWETLGNSALGSK